tara:strand:+ start:463 stop:819 length:357 start_codon:yes stop_codon:yes gene_type:complete
MKFILIPLLMLLSTHPNIDTTLIKYGNISNFSAERNDKVAVVNSRNIYKKLPSYMAIEKEGAKKGSARYYELITKATKNYKRVLKAVAAEKNFVLIVESGGVVDYEYEEATLACIGKI